MRNCAAILLRCEMKVDQKVTPYYEYTAVLVLLLCYS